MSNNTNSLDLSHLTNNHQKIELGNFLKKGTPFITVDFPLNIKDPKIIHYRPEQMNQLSPSVIIKYLDESEYLRVIMVTSNIDKSFPTLQFLDILSHPKLKAIITHNPSIIHPKIFSLPLGPKWQIKSTLPFGESKIDRIDLYLNNCASNYLKI